MQVISSGTQNLAANNVEYEIVNDSTEHGIFVLSLDLNNVGGGSTNITVNIEKKVLTGGTLHSMLLYIITTADGITWDSPPFLSSFQTRITIKTNINSPFNMDWSFQKL